MKLKKNDKIILIVGVVILIAAGAGIALYTVEDSDDAEVKEDTNLFSYTWIKKEGTLDLLYNEYVSINEPFEDILNINTPSNSVLTKIEMMISWQDDRTYGLLTEKGLDTLNAEITRGTDMKSVTSEGGGNETLIFTINSIPQSDTVEATSTNDAMDMIDDMIRSEQGNL